jgi:hypothetical protein
MCCVPGYSACLSCTAAVMVVSYLNGNEILSNLFVWSACSDCESDVVDQLPVCELAIEWIVWPALFEDLKHA